MLAAGRTGAEIARIFRVHRATISRIAAEARSLATDATPPPQSRTRTEPASAQNQRRTRVRRVRADKAARSREGSGSAAACLPLRTPNVADSRHCKGLLVTTAAVF
jgi:hypothetical protein